MRLAALLAVVLALLVGGLFAYNSGWLDRFGALREIAAEIDPEGQTAQALPPADIDIPSEEPVGDGGAEQLPDEALPDTPVEPVPPEAPPPAAGFDHHPPGALLPGSGSGYLDRTAWSPDMCFPLEEAAYPNSQVYGPGGGMGPKDKPSQCDPLNYSLPWRDNFCESRGYASPTCANGKGHQGQDIRPATCKKAVHWAVAAEDGIVTDIGSYTVTLTGAAAPHRVYRYLHLAMSGLAVSEGMAVTRGQRIGKVSNDFGGTPTTIHMHFEIRAGVAGTTTDGKPVVLHTFLPPYLSLVKAYERKLGGQGCG